MRGVTFGFAGIIGYFFILVVVGGLNWIALHAITHNSNCTAIEEYYKFSFEC